jgi:thioredoxin 1
VLVVNEKTFSDEVLASPKPVLINFWAPWCGLCRMMNPLLNRLQTEWGDQIKLVSINADENLKLANEFRLTTLPTLLLLDNGNALYRLEDFRTYDDLRNAVSALELAISATQPGYRYSA